MAATLRDLNTKFTKEQAAQFEAAAQQNQGVSGDLAQGYEAGKSSALGQLNTLAGHGMNALGFDGSARLQAAQENQQLAQEEAQGLTEFKDVDGLRSGLRWAAGALGQSAPVVLPAIGAGLLTGGSLPAALAAGSAAALPFELGGQLQRQEADPTTAGMSSGERLALAAPGAIGAAVAQNVVPAGVAGRILGKGAAGGLKTIIGRAAADVPANAAGEGAAEIARQFSDNLANPNAGYNLEAAKQAAIEGGAMGGVFGAAGAVPHLAHNIVKAPPQLAKDAFNFVGSKAKDAVTAAKDFDFVGAAKGAKDLAKEGYDLSADAAKSGFGAVKDAVEGIDLGGAAKNAMPFMRQQAENAVDATGVDIAGAAENAGPMAKAAARTTADFVGEQARKAKAAVEGFDTKPVKDRATAAYEKVAEALKGLGDAHARGMERVKKGDQYFNPESFAGKTEGALKAALDEDSALRDNAITKKFQELWNDKGLDEGQRAQLSEFGKNLKDGAAQRGVVLMGELRERSKRAMDSLGELAKNFAAKKPEGGTKLSADYSGVNKAVADSISSYVRDNLPHLADRRGTEQLGAGLRGAAYEMLSGKPLSSESIIRLLDVAGDHTAALLDRTREAMKVTDPKQLESFFESASQILQAQDRRKALKDTLAQEYKGEAPSEAVLDRVASEMLSWAVNKPAEGSRRKFSDAQMTQQLSQHFKNPGKVFDAVDAVIPRQENMLAGSPDAAKAAALAEERTARADAADAALAERAQEEGSDAGGEEGRSKLRPGEARGVDGELVGIESRPRLRTFREDGQDGLTMSEEFKPGKNGYPSSQAQALAKARAADPNARWATADELGPDHPFVKKQTDRLYEQAGLEQGLSGKEADAWVQGELKKYGTAVSELPAGHLALEPWEVSRMKVDKGYYNSPSAVKVGDGENVFDAAKIVAQMRKRSAGKESHMPTTGDKAGEQARLFADGVAALQAHLGKTFDIPDSTVIDATTKMTWGEARKSGLIKSNPAGVGSTKVPWELGTTDVPNDSLIPNRIQRMNEQLRALSEPIAQAKFAELKAKGTYPDTDLARTVWKWAREQAAESKEGKKLRAGIAKLMREHTQDEVGGFHSDDTNFNPTEQGFNLTRLTHAQEGKPGTFGGLADNSPRTKRLNELRQNLAAINPAPKSPWAKLHAQTQKRAILNEIRILESQTDSPLGSGKREFDPFGPTFQESKGLDKVTPDGIQEGLHSDLKAKVEGAGKLTPAAESDPRANQGDVRPSKAIAEHIRKLENMPPGKGLETLQRNRQIAEMVKTLEGRGFKLNSDGKWEKAGGANAVEGSPDPKAVAAKKAAFLEKAASGDAALLEELKASSDVKGLQRAAAALAEAGPVRDSGTANALRTVNDRLRSLAEDPDNAYAMLTKKYSMEGVDPNATGPRNFKEAADYIRKVLGPKIKVTVANLPHAGEFIAAAGNKVEDHIRLSMHSLNPMSGAFHESMHGFIKNLSRTKDGAIINVLRQAAESPTVLLALRKKLEGQPDAIKQLADPEERIAYMYQFHQLGVDLGLGKPAKGVFNRIAEYIRSLLGIWSNDRRALHVMDYFHSGEYAKSMGKPDVVRQALLEPGTNARVEWMKKATAPMRNLGEAVAVAGHQRLRDTGIPALNELADMIKRQGTSVGGDQGYLPTSRRERVMRLNAFAEKLGDVTDAGVAAALDVLQARDPNAANALKTPEERLAARAVVSNVRKLLAETKAYMEAAGVEVGDLGPDYFPRVYDLSYISANKEAFMKVLEDHGIKNPETVMQRLMTTEGAEFDVETSRPGMQHLKRRELAKVPDAALAPFMQKDLMRIVDGYVTQATRRAEWARRFDAPDAKGVMVPNKVFNDLLARAAQEGADPKDLDTATKYMMAVDGTLGDTISPEARRLQGNIMVYQNLRLLPLMVFSSVVDPAGIMVRGGTVGDAWHAFKRGIREIPKGFKDNPEHDAATKLAADIGVIESAVLTHALGTSFNQGMVGDTGRAINDKLFKYNLVEQFNTSMRVAATEAAVQFIAKHADGKASPHSARWMAELGLEPGDVKMSPEGKLIVRGNDKVIAAINQWVDGAVLRPDAADKPLWMSDPHYALVAHLKQFAFSFQETILKRVAHEMRNGNMAPAYALASYIPIMIAADATKAMLTGNELGNDEWGLDEYIGHGIERAGLLGVGQFPLDASQFGLTSVFGPTVEQLTQAVDVIAGDKEFAPFALKSMPANALYRGAFETGDVSEAKFRE